MKKFLKMRRLTALLLVLALLAGAIPVVLASNQTRDAELQQVPVTAEGLQTGLPLEEATDLPEDDELLRVIIIFDQASLVEKGYSTTGLGSNSAAVQYRGKLVAEQELSIAAVSRKLGETLDVRYNFTIGISGVATTVRYDQIAQIEAMEGVKSVYIENRYEPDEDEVDTSTAGSMVGSYSAWADGYTGVGTRVAVIDTGLDVDHPSFEESCYLYSVELAAARYGKELADYDLLDTAELTEVLPQLHAYERYAGLKAEDLYYSAKIPFTFNYVDVDLNVTHDLDAQGDHGTHVAGIATANAYVWGKDAEGDKVMTSQAQGVVGTAPDAQIIVMKVFGATGGAYDSDYMAALEDAILLNCDSVNLSLGSAYPGHTYSNYDELFSSLSETDTVVTISAGNKYSYAYFNNTGVSLQLTNDTVINTVGSPGAFGNSLAVASVDNQGLTGVIPTFNGVGILYSDTYENYKMNAFVTLDTSEDKSGTDYEYVFLGDPVTGTGIYGTAEDFEGMDFTGKIVLISRGGGVSFLEKANRAAEAGAAASVIYNNVNGSINMNLSDYGYKNPSIAIDLSYAKAILNASEQNEAGQWYGTMTIMNSVQVISNVVGGSIPSIFSSWGIPGNMDLKPEIIAPGGNIWSTLTDGTYGSMSGTSMSAPSVAGLAAVVAQYIRENALGEQEGMTVRALAQALLMSTSKPLMENDTIEYSPRKQGSGLADVYAAVTSPAFLLTDSREGTDGKVKFVLGDDPEKTGVYEMDFTVNNLSDEALEYVFSAAINTMATEEHNGEIFMSNSAYALSPEVSFTTEAPVLYAYDITGDNVVNSADAEVLLKIANGSMENTLSDEDMVKYDFDADGAITTNDAKIFLRAQKGKEDVDVFAVTYVVEAGGSISVHATVTLSEADRAYFAENYANGCYVEGYIYATDPKGVNAELSAPLVAYYGAWTDASMFDKYILMEDYSDPDAYPYVGATNVNAIAVDGYYQTANPYAADGTFLEDRTSISTSSRINGTYATLIRNAGGNLYTEISNADTGEVYTKVEIGAQYGAFYHTATGTWNYTSTGTTLNWKPLDAEGKPLPEGTRLKISVVAIPEYNWDRENGTVVGTLGEGASWDTYMTVDDTAPVILDGSVTTNWITGSQTLNVTAQDNRYVAAVLVFNERQSEVLARQGVEQTEINVPVDVEVDITGVEDDKIVVVAVDYAGNMTGYLVPLGSEEEERDVTEYIYLNDTFTDEWLTFKPDNFAAAKSVADGQIYAAEYIDGYVFSVDKDRRFCVAPLEKMEEQIYIATLDLPSAALDMAYNYADGKLYVLCIDNYLYTVDPLMGTTTLVGIVPISAGNDLQTLACSTDGTFYGVTNSGISSYGFSKLYSFTLGEEGFTVKAYPNNTGRSTIFIQSMAFDHNTGILYHANYGYNEDYTAYEGTLMSYDLESGAPTELADFGASEMAGMFIPRKTSSIFGPADKVTEITLSQTEISMLKGGTAALEVSAKPWTVVNRSCTWTTSDAAVATVTNGVITATGVGTCTISASSVLTPEVTATCTVTVTAVETDLKALVWDEDGAVWFSSFNTNTIPAYTKLTETACEAALMAMTTAPDGTVYAASYEESESGSLISSLYKVGKDYTLTSIGTSEIGYTDLTWCSNVSDSLAVATYGSHVVLVDTTTGGYSGAWDFSNYLNDAALVGITYYSSKSGNEDYAVDYCLLLDSAGNVWVVGFAFDGESYLRTTPQQLINLGCTTNGKWHFSSITTDGVYLYCSIFSGEKTDLVILDLNSGAVANVGTFGAGVWPVSGLQAERKDASADMVERAVEAAAQMPPAIVEAEKLPALDAKN